MGSTAISPDRLDNTRDDIFTDENSLKPAKHNINGRKQSPSKK